MGIGKLFKNEPKIATLHAERVAEVTKRREDLAERRQHLVWENERKLEAFDGGPGKELADYEAAIRAWETKHEETIATDALAALRKAASTFGDQPRTSTIAIRDAWRAYVRRVHEELGPEREPNFLLLAATFLDDDARDSLGSQAFLESRIIAGDLAQALAAIAGGSVPRTTYALQQLNIGVDEQARLPETEPNADASRAIATSATHATVSSRVNIGDPLTEAIASVLRFISTQHESIAEPPAEVIVQAATEPSPPVPEAFVHTAPEPTTETPFLDG